MSAETTTTKTLVSLEKFATQLEQLAKEFQIVLDAEGALFGRRQPVDLYLYQVGGDDKKLDGKVGVVLYGDGDLEWRTRSGAVFATVSLLPVRVVRGTKAQSWSVTISAKGDGPFPSDIREDFTFRVAYEKSNYCTMLYGSTAIRIDYALPTKLTNSIGLAQQLARELQARRYLISLVEARIGKE